jgi:uncharacterized protein (DUF1499 family)
VPNARPSFLAIVAAAIAGTALVLVVAGPLLANLGAIAPLQAFGLFALGSLLGLVGLVLGGIGLRVTRGGVAGRERAWFAVATGAVLVLVLLAAALPGRDLPRINDITTDPSDPPSFDAAADEAPNVGRDMGYDPTFAAIQREGYPDLAPVRLPVPPAAAYERALGAVDELGWERVASDPSQGRIEARETSRLFRFVDDIVIRVRAADGGSVVDVRSKSRDGRGDLGANAARIRAFVDALAADPAGR